MLCSGHPSSVDAVVKYDADTIITGSSDGIIRIINILPNRMLGVLGGTEDLPIERLALSHDRATLASVSHESCLRLWDLSTLAHESEDEEGAQEGEQADASVRHQVNFLFFLSYRPANVHQHDTIGSSCHSTACQWHI